MSDGENAGGLSSGFPRLPNSLEATPTSGEFPLAAARLAFDACFSIGGLRKGSGSTIITGHLHEETSDYHKDTKGKAQHKERCGPTTYEARKRHGAHYFRSGIAGIVCVHGVGHTFSNVKKGEKYCLVPQNLKRFVNANKWATTDRKGVQIILGYDIVCLFLRWLNTHENQYVKDLEGITRFVGPAFHLSTHAWSCFKKHHPTLNQSCGITDFEANERFWSWLKSTVPRSINYMANATRIETLEAGMFIANTRTRARFDRDIIRRFRRAEARIARATVISLKSVDEQVADVKKVDDLSNECASRLHKLVLDVQLRHVKKVDRGLRRNLEKKLKKLSKATEKKLDGETETKIVGMMRDFAARKTSAGVPRAIQCHRGDTVLQARGAAPRVASAASSPRAEELA